VMCVDVDAAKIDKLKQGILPIYEPGLDTVVEENFGAGRLLFTTDAKSGVEFGEIIFIAVGTPPDEDGSADLKYVLAVAGTIAEHMNEPKVVVDKSTVPVGTADKVKARIAEGLAKRGQSIDYWVVSNPDFLKEGAAVADFMRPDRIGVGTDSDYARDQMHELYAPFNRSHDRMIVMEIRSAELTKYAANAMLATKISFMNEIANLAERLGADIENVRLGIGADARIGYHFIYPGCGYGGSCFPKDVQALERTAREVGYQAELLQAVEAVNYRQKSKLFEMISRHFNGDLSGKVIAVWGLAFKPQTDDMREASARVLMESLWAAGARVQAYDPEAMDEAHRIYGDRADLALMGSRDATLEGADALAICTEWKAFRVPDFALLQARLKQPLIFDGRNLYDPEQLAELGFVYYGIGRGQSIKRA